MPNFFNFLFPSYYLSWSFNNDCTNIVCHVLDSIDKGIRDPKTSEAFGRLWSNVEDNLESIGKRSTEVFAKFVKNFDFIGKTSVVGEELIKNFDVFGKDFGEAFKRFTINFNNGLFDGIRDFRYRYLLEIFPLIIGSTAVTLIVNLGIRYFYKKLSYNIGRPKLASEFYKASKFSLARGPLKGLIQRVEKIFFKVKSYPVAIFNKRISKSITNITRDLQNIIKNKGHMQNVLLYGPPGIGKTMVSRDIAKKAGVNFILMSGGDLPQYIRRGEHVSEFNKLIDFAEKSSQPTVIFIDESESLCRKRENLSQEMLELQNAFLNRTGTQSKKVMLILATNRKDDLDDAVLSRMDYKINIDLPGFEERVQMIQMYARQFFTELECSRYFNSTFCRSLALRTSEFTGRNLNKMISIINNRRFAETENSLSHRLINDVTSEFIQQERKELKPSVTMRVRFVFQDFIAFFMQVFAKNILLLRKS